MLKYVDEEIDDQVPVIKNCNTFLTNSSPGSSPLNLNGLDIKQILLNDYKKTAKQ